MTETTPPVYQRESIARPLNALIVRNVAGRQLKAMRFRHRIYNPAGRVKRSNDG